MNRKHALMAVGFAISAWLAFFTDKPVDDGLVAPVVRATGSAGQPVSGTYAENKAPLHAEAKLESKADDVRILDLIARDEPDSDSADSKLFSSHSWTPPPKPVKPPPPPPPTAPPVPFAYLGMQQIDGRYEVFLQRGEEVLVVGEKTVIDNTYRVDVIRPPALSLVYLPLNQTQTIAIGVID